MGDQLTQQNSLTCQVLCGDDTNRPLHAGDHRSSTGPCHTTAVCFITAGLPHGE